MSQPVYTSQTPILKLALRTLRHQWAMSAAVALGVAVAAAVLVGALAVGDSMREGLERLTLERLGRIDSLLLVERPFDVELADRLKESPDFKQDYKIAEPVMIQRASAETIADTSGDDPNSPTRKRAGRVTLLGIESTFWALDTDPARHDLPEIKSGEVWINRPLAERLGVTEGDELILRTESASAVPSESLLGREDESLATLRLEIAKILPATGLARFAISADQRQPLTAFVSLRTLQRRLDSRGRVNAILVSAGGDKEPPSVEAERRLQAAIRPTLDDYGINVVRSGDKQWSCLNISSERMILGDPIINEIRRAVDTRSDLSVQPALTYLVEKIYLSSESQDESDNADPSTADFIPYSTVTAIDPGDTAPFGPLTDDSGSPIDLTADQTGDAIPPIVLNDWSAEDLGITPGDETFVTLQYRLPEDFGDRPQIVTKRFRLAGIARMTGLAATPQLTPDVEGITDTESLGDWDPPFQPFHYDWLRKPEPGEKLGRDDQYWEDHRATPKAFVPLAAGRQLWGSRFGATTSLRVWPTDAQTTESPLTADSLTALLEKELDPAKLGFHFQAIRREGIEASAGTTPFGVLFVSLSFFIIAAAVMLTVLLARLSIDRRSQQLGLLGATGWTPRRIRRLLLIEGGILSITGSAIGIPLGIGYAAAMIAGLHSLWIGAIAEPFMRLTVSPVSISIAAAITIGLTWSAIALAVRKIGRIPAQRLLAAGGIEAATSSVAPSKRRPIAEIAAVSSLVLAAVIGIVAQQLGEQARAGAFFSAAALGLIGLLLVVNIRLKRASSSRESSSQFSLRRLAMIGAARNPSQSTLTIGLVAATTFLIVSTDAFRKSPDQQVEPPAGTALAEQPVRWIVELDRPLTAHADRPAGTERLGFSEEETAWWNENVAATTFRTVNGDDASCLNLYLPRRPRMIGVQAHQLQGNLFRWASHEPLAENASKPTDPGPWRLLDVPIKYVENEQGEQVPEVSVVIEKNTALYSLHLWGGIGSVFETTDRAGRPIRLRVVGLTDGNYFQSDVMMSEANLLQLFPESAGRRILMLRTKQDDAGRAAAIVDRRLGDFGPIVERPTDRLNRLQAVNNTYLSTFQSLGGLGLLLGTLGLAVVQIRQVYQRRGELALLRAVGYAPRRVGLLILLEGAVLLTAGLVCGIVAALVSLLPHIATTGATVPWSAMIFTPVLIWTVGLGFGLIAARAAARSPVMTVLRKEH